MFVLAEQHGNRGRGPRAIDVSGFAKASRGAVGRVADSDVCDSRSQTGLWEIACQPAAETKRAELRQHLRARRILTPMPDPRLPAP